MNLFKSRVLSLANSRRVSERSETRRIQCTFLVQDGGDRVERTCEQPLAAVRQQEHRDLGLQLQGTGLANNLNVSESSFPPEPPDNNSAQPTPDFSHVISFFFLIFFFNVYLFLRQRETEHGGGSERGRHRI